MYMSICSYIPQHMHRMHAVNLHLYIFTVQLNSFYVIYICAYLYIYTCNTAEAISTEEFSI